MAFTLTVDTTDLSTLGLTVLDPGGLWDSIRRRTEWVRRANSLTALELSIEDQVEPRDVFLRAAVTAADLATLDTNLDKIKYICRTAPGGTLTVEMSDRARIINAKRAGEIEVRQLVRSNVRVARQVVIPLIGLDPRWHDKTNQTPALSTTEADTPLGDAEVEDLVITGLPGTCTIEYRSSASAVLKTFGYTSIASTPVTVDFEAKTVVDNGGTARPSAIDAGSEYFKLDPKDGNFLASAWPKLRLTAGTGTATYPRAWD